MQQATFFTATYVEVVLPSAAAAAALLGQYRDPSRSQDGALRLEVMRRVDRPNQLTVLAAWTDPGAFEAHLGTDHGRQLSEGLATMLAAPNDTRRHQRLSVGLARAGRRASLAVVTHVDVVPAHKDNGAVALGQLAEESRRHAGNLRLEVWQQIDRPNHFTVVETWSGRQRFDAHMMAARPGRFGPGWRR